MSTIPDPATTDWVPLWDLGRQPVKYLGDYAATTTYNDGDVVIGPDGIAYVCVMDNTLGVTPAWSGSNPPGIPLPVVNNQFIKGIGGSATWSLISTGDLNNLVATAPTAILGTKLVSTDTQPAFRINGDGTMNWGPGGASAPDTSLYRTAAASLGTNGAFAANTGAPNQILLHGNGYLYFGSALDTNLYRPLASNLATTANFNAQFQQGPHVAIGNVIAGLPGIQFGAGGDTLLYRNGANLIAHYNGSAWGTFQAAAFSVTSDRRRKSEGERAEVDVAKLLSAGIYTYLRGGSDERHLGLYADDLPAEVISEGHVVEDDDEPLQFVDLYKLTTALLATVQHLNERLTVLESS